MGNAVVQWLRCCTTNRKVAGWIPAGVTGISIYSHTDYYVHEFIYVLAIWGLR